MLSQSLFNIKKQKYGMEIWEFRKIYFLMSHAFKKKKNFHYIKIYNRTKKLLGCCVLTTEFC